MAPGLRSSTQEVRTAIDDAGQRCLTWTLRRAGPAGGDEMITIDIPGWRHLELRSLVLDVNGTLSLDGRLLPEVGDRIRRLRPELDIRLLSADTHGRLRTVASHLDVPFTRIDGGGEKARLVRELGAAHVVAIGNGANDADMLAVAALGVVVLGHEGAATSALLAGQVVTGSVHEALDLLLHPRRLVATLRR